MNLILRPSLSLGGGGSSWETAVIGWLVGIGIAGFFVSLGLGVAMRPRQTSAPWWIGTIAVAIFGAGLGALLAWPGWHFGAWLGGTYDLSATLGGALGSCIFGLGGAATTGGIHVARKEEHKGPR